MEINIDGIPPAREINKTKKPPVIPSKFDTYRVRARMSVAAVCGRMKICSSDIWRNTSRVSSIFRDLRRSVKSPKKFAGRESSPRRRFLRPAPRRILRAARKRGPLKQTRRHVSAILQAGPRARQDGAELSGKKRALHDPAAIETPLPDTNISFARNRRYLLYSAYSELLSERSAINTSRTCR